MRCCVRVTVAVGYVFGPALGFMLTGSLLSVWVNLGTPPYGITVKDAAWAGAWWLPFVICAAGLLVLCGWGLRFPRYMPNTEHIRAALHSSGEVQADGQPRGEKLHMVDADERGDGGDGDGDGGDAASTAKYQSNGSSPRAEARTAEATPGSSETTLWESLRTVLTHKVTMLVTCASVCDALIINAFAGFLPKVFQVCGICRCGL